jgi:hypothetical protein
MEILAFVIAVIFWWTFWNRLNRIMIAVERVADHVSKGTPTSAGTEQQQSAPEKNLFDGSF